jgi:hypothetical protein
MEVPLASAALDVVGHLLRFDEPTTVQELKSAGIEAAPLGSTRSAIAKARGS